MSGFGLGRPVPSRGLLGASKGGSSRTGVQAARGPSWSIDSSTEWIEVTSMLPTPNENWRYTDPYGHEHHYDHGWPTLKKVIDEEHFEECNCYVDEWDDCCDCDMEIDDEKGQMVVDKSHWECRTCERTIEPAMDPANMRKYIAGRINLTLKGVTSEGFEITWSPWDEDEVDAFTAAYGAGKVQEFIDAIPHERLSSCTNRYTS